MARGFKWDAAELKQRLAQFDENVNRAVETSLRYMAPQVQNHLRANAPWTDRTANARQGLFARQARQGDRHAIIAYHSVPYGIWLEVRWDGRYSIIRPTIQTMGPLVMGALAGLFGRLGR